MNNVVFSYGVQKKRKSKHPLQMLKRLTCFILFVLLTLVCMYNFQIIPALIPFAEAQTTTEITAKLQRVVGKKIASGSYSDFVQLRYGEDGSVVSLETNTSAISLLAAEIADASVTELSQSDTLTVEIPIGSLSGGALLSGRGPRISIPIAISPKITCEIENEFYESGINQTLHRIIAEIEVETYALLPLSHRKIRVETEYCIAETIIVGKVPDAYTNIHRLTEDITESDIDDIYDFGASVE